jgi:hypothetical protein
VRAGPSGHTAAVNRPGAEPPAQPEPPEPAVGARPVDPVLARRRQVARAAEIGQRIGYALFGLAVVVFVVGFVLGLTGAVVVVVVTALVVGSLVLAPAIVAGYGVKAADREDRERGREV